jgi:hypothetical protein
MSLIATTCYAHVANYVAVRMTTCHQTHFNFVCVKKWQIHDYANLCFDACLPKKKTKL